jgi:hypothetical protein
VTPVDVEVQSSESSGNELSTTLDTKTLEARSMVPDEFRPPQPVTDPPLYTCGILRLRAHFHPSQESPEARAQPPLRMR